MHEALISRVGLHLRSWVTGRPPVGGAAGDGTVTVVLEDPDHLEALFASDVVGPRTLVLVPGEQDGEQDGEEHHGSGATVVGYEGSLSEPSGDASIGGALFLQVQDYGTSPYMSLLGTTLVRVAGQADFEAFLADADLARAEGEFAAFAVSPAVQIADLVALGADPGDGPDTRLYVGRDGGISVSPHGLRLGTVGEGAAALRAEWNRLTADSPQGGPVALGAVVPEDVRGSAVRERPWLGRYLGALDVLRDLQAHGISELRVSGFGRRLVSALDAVEAAADLEDPRAPFLAWTPEAAYVRVPGHDRTFRLGRQAAEVTEMLLVHGGADALLEHAAGDDGTATARPVHRAAIDQVIKFFDDRGAPLLTGSRGAEVKA